MSEWKEFKLEEITTKITDGKHGDCVNQAGSGWYFVSCKDIANGTIDYGNARQITESDALEVRKRIAVEPEDSVMTNSGTIGRMAYITDDPRTYRTAFQKSVAVIKPDKNAVDPKFLYYLLLNSADDLARNSNGSAQKNLLLGTMREYRLKIPEDTRTQQEIVSILSTFDELIENNRKQIKLLEEAAQRLYKEWFVDLRFPGHETVLIDPATNLPEGWNKGSLSDVVEFKRGKTITAAQTEKGSVPVVAGGLGPAYYHSRSNATGPVVTVSGSGANAGFTRLYTMDIWASDCSYVDSTMTDVLAFVYESVNCIGKGFKHLQRGSAQPHVYPSHINGMEMLIPPTRMQEAFCEFVDPIISKISLLDRQMESSREARDRLLPKLMSGEIEVS